jgi:hypothetical protein
MIASVIPFIKRLVISTDLHIYIPGDPTDIKYSIGGVKVHALNIEIANRGSNTILIHKAGFSPYYRKSIFQKANTNLEIHPKAAKDTKKELYELKFNSNRQPIQPGNNTANYMDYLSSTDVSSDIPDKKNSSRIRQSSSLINESQVIIKPDEVEHTFLPLSKPIAQHIIDSRQCGTVVLEYSTTIRRGSYKTRI